MCVMWYVWNFKLYWGEIKFSIGFLYLIFIMNFILVLMYIIFLGNDVYFIYDFDLKSFIINVNVWI